MSIKYKMKKIILPCGADIWAIQLKHIFSKLLSCLNINNFIFTVLAILFLVLVNTIWFVKIDGPLYEVSLELYMLS